MIVAGHNTSGCRLLERRFLSIWLTSMILAAVPSAATAQDAVMKQRLNELHKIYEAREQRRNPIWLQFTIVKKETPHWQKLFSKGKASSDVTQNMECQFAKRGDFYHSSAKKVDPLRPNQELRSFTICNEQFSLSTISKENTFLLQHKPEYIQHGELPFSMTREDVLCYLLAKWAHGDNPLKAIEWNSRPEGTIELIFTCIKSGWKYQYVLDPSLEYVPLSSTSYTAANAYIDRTEVQSYESFAGIPVPIKGKLVHYADVGKVGFTSDFTVTSCKTAAGDIPDRLFHYDLPDDAIVVDMDKKITVRKTASTQRDWDDIVRLVGPRKTRWWIWTAAGIALFAAVAVIVVLRRRARPA